VLLLLSHQANAQLLPPNAVHHFGDMHRDTPAWVDLPVVNRTGRDAVLFRLEVPPFIDVAFSKKIIPPDSTGYIRLLIKPQAMGPFRLSLPLYASAWQEPQYITLTGVAMYTVDLSAPCPSFADSPPGKPRTLDVTVRYSDQRPAPYAAVQLYQNGRRTARLRANDLGYAELQALSGLSLSLLVATTAAGAADTTLYVHGINQHVVITLPAPSETAPAATLNPPSPPVKAAQAAISEMPKLHPVLPEHEYKPANVVFLVDVSASMKQEGRLELLK
jgi:hypothetical protein